MDEEFRDKVAPKIIKLLEKFATHTEKPRHELKGYGYFGCCRYKDFEKSGELGIRIPIEFSSDEYLYYIDLNDIEVYKRVVEQSATNATNATKKMSELPPAEQEKRREKRRKYKALKEISETAYNLRLEFVRAFSRKTINAAEIKALSELAFAAVCFGGKLELSIYSKAEDIQLGSTWQMSYSQKKELAKGTAPKVLLMALYSTFRDSADNRYYNTTSETTAEQAGSHKENSMLDAIYECLCTLGYVMSDDEKALQDGTHENFNSESSAEIKAAA
jgi:ParB family chromosome partitioning protein